MCLMSSRHNGHSTDGNHFCWIKESRNKPRDDVTMTSLFITSLSWIRSLQGVTIKVYRMKKALQMCTSSALSVHLISQLREKTRQRKNVIEGHLRSITWWSREMRSLSSALCCSVLPFQSSLRSEPTICLAFAILDYALVFQARFALYYFRPICYI